MYFYTQCPHCMKNVKNEAKKVVFLLGFMIGIFTLGIPLGLILIALT